MAQINNTHLRQVHSQHVRSRKTPRESSTATLQEPRITELGPPSPKRPRTEIDQSRLDILVAAAATTTQPSPEMVIRQQVQQMEKMQEKMQQMQEKMQQMQEQLNVLNEKSEALERHTQLISDPIEFDTVDLGKLFKMFSGELRSRWGASEPSKATSSVTDMATYIFDQVSSEERGYHFQFFRSVQSLLENKDDSHTKIKCLCHILTCPDLLERYAATSSIGVYLSPIHVFFKGIVFKSFNFQFNPDPKDVSIRDIFTELRGISANQTDLYKSCKYFMANYSIHFGEEFSESSMRFILLLCTVLSFCDKWYAEKSNMMDPILKRLDKKNFASLSNDTLIMLLQVSCYGKITLDDLGIIKTILDEITNKPEPLTPIQKEYLQDALDLEYRFCLLFTNNEYGIILEILSIIHDTEEKRGKDFIAVNVPNLDLPSRVRSRQWALKRESTIEQKKAFENFIKLLPSVGINLQEVS